MLDGQTNIVAHSLNKLFSLVFLCLFYLIRTLKNNDMFFFTKVNNDKSIYEVPILKVISHPHCGRSKITVALLVPTHLLSISV